jgi:hypothetical protein
VRPPAQIQFHVPEPTLDVAALLVMLTFPTLWLD